MSMPATSLPRRITADDFNHAGPDAPAGQYLRKFWQPVYHSSDLRAERPVPLRILGESFTLYRGANGQSFIVDQRCPHRGLQLSTGWVEGDDLRCFYHGWKFSGDGKCIQQPVENNAFCDKVKLRSYPVREYLGLIFGYFGEGEPPAFPLYPEFEHFDGYIETNSYVRDCNYFQNLENSLDTSHVGFVHGGNSASFEGFGQASALTAEESDWGVAYTFTRPGGASRTHQFGMPNLFYFLALPVDEDVGWQESLMWFVPIDDERHMQFWLHRVRAEGDRAQRIQDRREKRRSQIDLAHQDVAEEIVNGRINIRDVDPARVDMVQLEDDVAQIGQGRIVDRGQERLGRGDVGVVAIRRLWIREVTAMLEGRPLKQWHKTEACTPSAWALDGGRTVVGGAGAKPAGGAASKIFDSRPHVEVERELSALRGEPRRR
jgi:5,5'-dehydrodivanillate O-demethylase oxygenase subunit